jgi:hypothetical protein
LAVHRAASVRAGLHQQAGDRLARQCGPQAVLELSRSHLPAYSQGVYAHDDEPLAKALERKFDWAIAKCELKLGKTVLEIGPGWGALPISS